MKDCKIIVMEHTVAYANFLVNIQQSQDLLINEIHQAPLHSTYKQIVDVVGYFIYN